jgi:hypothetical protein
MKAYIMRGLRGSSHQARVTVSFNFDTVVASKPDFGLRRVQQRLLSFYHHNITIDSNDL